MKIYIASKAHHRPLWRRWRDDHKFNIISRWIDTEDKYSEDPTGLNFSTLWRKCQEDVEKCDVLVCVTHPHEVLKGAILEIGMALALFKQVFVVGAEEDYLANGSWINHPYVNHCGAMTDNELFHFLQGLSLASRG